MCAAPGRIEHPRTAADTDMNDEGPDPKALADASADALVAERAFGDPRMSAIEIGRASCRERVYVLV